MIWSSVQLLSLPMPVVTTFPQTTLSSLTLPTFLPSFPSPPSPLLRYILRRYLGGEDKEESAKVHRNFTDEEWEKVKKQVRGRGHGGGCHIIRCEGWVLGFSPLNG